MLKKNKSRRGSKKSKHIVAARRRSVGSLIKQNRWLALVVLIILLTTLGAIRLSKRVDLGPQLPPPPADALYKQANQPIDARVKDLLERMTLEEKIGQMSLVDKNSLDKIEDISKYSLGGILSGAGAKPSNNTQQGWLEMVNGMKNEAAASRLQIPILYGVDATHGHANVPGATVFPHAIGLGASSDTELVKNIAEATSAELRATGINWNYSPMLDAPKDIRWGRVYEAFSDNPVLNGTLGAAYVAGTQTVLTNQGVQSYTLATAKHYPATGAMEWGRSNHKKFKIDQGMTTADEQALTEEYLPPFKAAVDAGVSSVMVGLTHWGSTRVIDSKYLLTDKLKGELGFKGFVVSDWYGVYEYSRTSKYQANITTINAGLDMAMLPYDYKEFLGDVRGAVQENKISQSRIDDAVSRILYQKFKAGLFDQPPSTASVENVGSQQHRQLARKAAASSMVLLKNEGSLLPLAKNTERILVAGSAADNVGRQCGAWTVEWQGIDGNWLIGSTSILQGIRQVAGAAVTVDYSKNADYVNTNTKAAVGIAVVSEKPYAEGHGDNANPTLDEADKQAIEKLKSKSEKVIVIVISGRPLLIAEQIAKADAVIAGWLPGSEGAGVADVLFGDQAFKAKLPLPWPSSVQQLPVESNGRTKDNTLPLFERSFGLTT